MAETVKSYADVMRAWPVPGRLETVAGNGIDLGWCVGRIVWTEDHFEGDICYVPVNGALVDRLECLVREVDQ